MRLLSLSLATAIASSHLAEAHDVRTGNREQHGERNSHTAAHVRTNEDESRGKPGIRTHSDVRTESAVVDETDSRGKQTRHNPKTVERVGDLRTDDGPSLIVGEDSTSVGEFPYYVDMDGCGGSLIAPGVVLSAAHCEPPGFSYVDKKVIVGANVRQQVTNGAQEATVTKTISHPLYESQPQYEAYLDVMLMQLDTEVTTTGSVTLSLNTDGAVPVDDQMLTVIGTGSTQEDGEPSDQLLQVDVATVDTETCNVPYEGQVSDEVMFCAGGNGSQDSCQGDSGGPIVVQEGDSHRQVGIVSWGNGCAQLDNPGVYARVSATMDFIAYVACECFGVTDESICSHMDPNDNFSCDQNAGSDGGTDTGPDDGEPGADGPGCQIVSGWVDEYGDSCGWYENNDEEGCPNDGHAIGDDGIPASEACCYCAGTSSGGGTGDGGDVDGGSTGGCEDYPEWVDDWGDGCDFYEDDDACDEWGTEVGTDDVTASAACCACTVGSSGGSDGDEDGDPTGGCEDYPDWLDDWGDSCDFYDITEGACDQWGTEVGSDGVTAAAACCVCAD